MDVWIWATSSRGIPLRGNRYSDVVVRVLTDYSNATGQKPHIPEQYSTRLDIQDSQRRMCCSDFASAFSCGMRTAQLLRTMGVVYPCDGWPWQRNIPEHAIIVDLHIYKLKKHLVYSSHELETSLTHHHTHFVSPISSSSSPPAAFNIGFDSASKPTFRRILSSGS